MSLSFSLRFFHVPFWCACFGLASVLAAPPTATTAAYRVSPAAGQSVEVSSAGGGSAIFSPDFIVQFSATDPGLEFRWGKFADPALRLIDTGSVYNVLTWGRKTKEGISTKHIEDGFDPAADRGYGPGRTADLFAAAVSERLKATARRDVSGKITWEFPVGAKADLRAELEASPDGHAPRLKFIATAKTDGWYSFGYVGAPAAPPAEIDELWQPLIFNERRLPEASFLEAAFRCPLPTTLVTRSGVTVGVVADSAEYPFQPMPNLQNSQFGVALRNAQGQAQPMLFAPLLGGLGSKMKAGETRAFTVRLVAEKADIAQVYENVARTLFGFSDVRHNVLGSLNATFERMLAFGLSDYAKFNADLRGFAYDTDVPGAVKNVSALHPLGIALATDNREIFTQLARPLMEYFISRERFLFTTDPKVKGQSASSRLGGLGAPLSEYATLYALSGRRTPFFLTSAESLFNTTRVLNLEAALKGDFWANSLALYRASGDRKWLDRATHDADDYLRRRTGARPTDFDDPDSRGLFFWPSFVPQWIELYELYEETGEKRYLEAAHAGARAYAQYIWLAPQIPDGDVTVNDGGYAPSYRSGGKFPRAKLAEETVPAWRVSEIGLTSESAPTSKGARGILLACYAPWMLRISAMTKDNFLHDLARSAIIGRYTSFPGYHMNTGRTTVYEKPNFAERGKDELNALTSIHYNHIWPHLALVLDYLVSDVFAKSVGRVDFPGRYAEGYGYLQQKIYGDRAGPVYDAGKFYPWMPRGVVSVDHPELNYVTGRAEGAFVVALTNQSKSAVTSRVQLNRELVGWDAAKSTTVLRWEENVAQKEAGRLTDEGALTVTVAPEGITVVVIRGVKPRVGFQAEVTASGDGLPKSSVTDLHYHGAKAVALSFGAGNLTSVYAYLPDFDREVKRCTLTAQQGGVTTTWVDEKFPFDYTVPVSGLQPVELTLDVDYNDGRKERSPAGRVELR